MIVTESQTVLMGLYISSDCRQQRFPSCIKSDMAISENSLSRWALLGVHYTLWSENIVETSAKQHRRDDKNQMPIYSIL